MDEGLKKILLVTFSDNADHQEVMYSLFEELLGVYNVWAMGIKEPKVPHVLNDKIKYVNAPRRPGITKGTFNLAEIFRILRFIRKEKFDAIYFETLHTWNIPIWMFHKKKTQIIQAMHDVEPHEGDSSVKAVEIMNKVAVKLADIILLRNAGFVSLLKQKYGAKSEKIVALDPWRRFPQYDPETHSHRALFFGRINEYKGVEYIPKIVELCPEVQFDIVGRIDKTVESIVEDIKGKQNVNLVTEYVTDEQMRYYFHQCDFVILPYKSASQSGVVLDADKFGRPPIAFATGAIANQIENGKNGVLVPAGDVEKFADEVKIMATLSDEKMEAFSENVYKYAYERYSSVKCAEKFTKIINEVLLK